MREPLGRSLVRYVWYPLVIGVSVGGAHALIRAGIEPGQIQYVEAHGTGTRAGDIAEAHSLAEALASCRSADAGPLLIGSAKSNIGHLEAAAGIEPAMEVLQTSALPLGDAALTSGKV